MEENDEAKGRALALTVGGAGCDSAAAELAGGCVPGAAGVLDAQPIGVNDACDAPRSETRGSANGQSNVKETNEAHVRMAPVAFA